MNFKEGKGKGPEPGPGSLESISAESVGSRRSKGFGFSIASLFIRYFGVFWNIEMVFQDFLS